PNGLPGRITKAAATGSSRLMPRLPHRPSAARNPSGLPDGSVSVRGASRPTVAAATPLTDVLMSLLPTPALPGQVPAVGGGSSHPLSPVIPELPLTTVATVALRSWPGEGLA